LNEPVRISFPPQVARMIEECHKSGLYGDTPNEVLLSLIRPGLLQAVSAGIAKLKR
jgi:hypothetical protein